MRIEPTSDGGRRLAGVTPWGSYAFTFRPTAASRNLRVIDEDGHVVGDGAIEFRSPPPSEVAAIEHAEGRRGPPGCCGG